MRVEMDAKSWEGIKGLEKHSRFPTGIGKIDRGECERGALNPIACMFCTCGHMLECHYPHTCDEVKCSHYEQAMETEDYL